MTCTRPRQATITTATELNLGTAAGERNMLHIHIYDTSFSSQYNVTRTKKERKVR